MVAEYRASARPLRQQRAAANRHAAPDVDVLCARVRALWRKERRLGAYAPADEVCLDLEALDIEALRGLRARIRARIASALAPAEVEA
jgi:hypothetical protein